MLSFMRKQREGWLAVALAPDRIDIAQVQRRPGSKPKVLRLESYARGSDDVQALTTLSKKKGLANYCCTNLLEPGAYQIVPVEGPDVPPEELREAVRWGLKDTLGFPVETATIDVAELPIAASAGRRPPLLAVAAENQLIAARMKLFDAAGLKLGAIDIPEMAQRNIASFLEDENRGLAMLTLDESGGMLTFTYRGELCVARRIEATTSSVRVEGAEEGQRQQLYERAALELQRSLDNFERQYTSISVSKIVLGPVPALPGLLEHLREYVYLPVVPLDLTQIFDCTDVPELAQPALQAERLVVLGAALREEAGEVAA